MTPTVEIGEVGAFSQEPAMQCECGAQDFREEQRGWMIRPVVIDVNREIKSYQGSAEFVEDDGGTEFVCNECGVTV